MLSKVSAPLKRNLNCLQGLLTSFADSPHTYTVHFHCKYKIDNVTNSNATPGVRCLEILRKEELPVFFPNLTKTKTSYSLLEEKHVLYIQITPPSWSLLHCLLGSVNSASVSECGAKTRHCGQSHRKLRRQTTSHPV